MESKSCIHRRLSLIILFFELERRVREMKTYSAALCQGLIVFLFLYVEQSSDYISNPEDYNSDKNISTGF